MKGTYLTIRKTIITSDNDERKQMGTRIFIFNSYLDIVYD